MALPIIPNSSLCQFVLKGFSGDTKDMENVLYGIYQTGLAPTPGGMHIDEVGLGMLTSWASLWNPFQTTHAGFTGYTIRHALTLVGLGGHKWKLTAQDQWSAAAGPLTGAGAGDVLPSFNAYSVEKRITLAGKGKQGHVRVWGVPVVAAVDNEIEGATFGALQAAITAYGVNPVIASAPFSDFVSLVVVDGNFVNAHSPVVLPNVGAQSLIQGMVLSDVVGTQVTRKLGRRRR